MAGPCSGCGGNGSALVPCEVCGAGLGVHAAGTDGTGGQVEAESPPEATPEAAAPLEAEAPVEAEAQTEDAVEAEVTVTGTGYDSVLPSDDE